MEVIFELVLSEVKNYSIYSFLGIFVGEEELFMIIELFYSVVMKRYRKVYFYYRNKYVYFIGEVFIMFFCLGSNVYF